MSSFKRLVDIARAEVGSVLEKAEKVGERVTERVTGHKKPLDEFSDDELSAEIERRRMQKQQREEEAAGKAAAAAKRAKSEPTSGQTAADPGPAAAPPPRAQKIVARGVEQYYANLEVEPGADLETIKRAYRRLMRKYHPDKHANDPAKHKAATELAQNLTKAYMELKKHLEG